MSGLSSLNGLDIFAAANSNKVLLSNLPRWLVVCGGFAVLLNPVERVSPDEVDE
jgi:hypothetical protein